MKYFYTHLIEIESLIIEMDSLGLSKEDKHHLANLLDANLHNTILDAVLSELKEEDRDIFLKHLTQGDHGALWEHLNGKIEDIEGKIKKVAAAFHKEMKKDIKTSQGLKVKT